MKGDEVDEVSAEDSRDQSELPLITTLNHSKEIAG